MRESACTSTYSGEVFTKLTVTDEGSQPWLKPVNRRVAPFNSFAEYAPEPNSETKTKDARSTTIGRCATSPAARIWTKFKGDRGTKSKPVPALIWSMAS